MEMLSEVLPIILYLVGVVLLVILIIIGVKIIRIIDSIDDIVKDVDYKVQSLNGVFKIIDTTTDRLAVINDKIVDVITNFILKLFKKKYNNKKEEKENSEKQEKKE